MGKKLVSILSEQSGRMTALGLVVTLSVTMVLSGVLLSQNANAGALTSVSDTLTESAPSSKSDHTIVFTPQTAGGANNHILIDFPGFTASGSLTAADVAVAGFTVSSISYTGTTLKIEVAEALTTSAKTVTVGGTNKLTNPSSEGSQQITVQTTTAADVLLDAGLTFVAIVNGVTMHAYVAPTFTFEIEGMTTSDLIDSQAVASESTATYVGFGTLTAGTPIMMGSSLSVTTNAQNGFKVTVHQNHNLLTSSSADIDSFADGTPTTGATWAAPTGTLGSESTYGHLGLVTEDASGTDITSAASVSSTTNGTWFGLNGSTPFEVWDWNAPADGYTQDIGHIDVGYRIQISALQEYGHYYNRLTYIATPTF